MKIGQVISILEAQAPIAYQEGYDNCGLLTGNREQDVTQALITLDCTEAVVEEAIQKKCNLIIAHHPIIFSGLKKLTGANYIERTIIKAIQNDIAIYAIHTNLDNIHTGVNLMIAQKLDLIHTSILNPKPGTLSKLITFIPHTHFEKVSNALFAIGCGNIGNYSHAGFSSSGTGTFCGNELSNPQIGISGQIESVMEIRFETIFPAHLQNTVLKTLKEHHPYEEVAFDVIALQNPNNLVGSGMIGFLKEPVDSIQFLALLKDKMKATVIRHTAILDKKIHKIALCGGSGSFLLKHAIAAKADAFVTADFKYHEFFDAENQLMITDIGHYESEQFTKELILNILSKKNSTFAVLLSEIETNPIKYYF